MTGRKSVTVRAGGQDVTTTASAAAAALGRLGGLAGRGKSKARSSEQARAAVNARWAKVRAARGDSSG